LVADTQARHRASLHHPGLRHVFDALVLEVHLAGEQAQFLGIDREVLAT
jgi:hypothetical protein